MRVKELLAKILEGESPEGVTELALDVDLVRHLLNRRTIRFMAGLEDFTDLEVLSLRQHAIRRVAGIAHLQHLRELDLSHNYVAMPEASAFPESLEWLLLDFNEVRDIRGLVGMPNLKYLSLANNEPLSHIDALGELPALEDLVISGCKKIRDLKGLNRSKTLRVLYAMNGRLFNWGKIEKIPTLEELHLSAYGSYQLAGFDGHTGLKKIVLQSEGWKSYIRLHSFPNLSSFSFTKGREIKRIWGFELCPNLKEVKLNNNNLAELPDFQEHPGIEVLDLRQNQLTDISGLATLQALRELRISENPLSEQEIAAFREKRPEVLIT